MAGLFRFATHCGHSDFGRCLVMNVKALFLCGLLACAVGCSDPEQKDTAVSPRSANSEDDITSYIQQRVSHLAYAYPEARVAGLRFSAGRTTVCGLLLYPGEQPRLFISTDLDPTDVEGRAVAMPFLTAKGDWRRRSKARLRLEALHAEQCERLGLMPDGFTVGAGYDR